MSCRCCGKINTEIRANCANNSRREAIETLMGDGQLFSTIDDLVSVCRVYRV